MTEESSATSSSSDVEEEDGDADKKTGLCQIVLFVFPGVGLLGDSVLLVSKSISMASAPATPMLPRTHTNSKGVLGTYVTHILMTSGPLGMAYT